MFSSLWLLVEAVLLVFSWKLACFLCVASETEGMNGAVHTTVLEVKVLEQQLGQGNLELLRVV